MIRFFGGRVMTLANGIETQDIEVWTEGSKIVFVGKPTAEELDGKVFEREYDLKGKSSYAVIQKCAHSLGNDFSAIIC